jgi:hypothetical protein
MTIWRSIPVIAVLGCANGGAHSNVDAARGHDGGVEDAASIDAPIDSGVPGCTGDSQCASGACDESTATCIDEANALYVATTGSDSGTCLRSAPCLTIARAAALLDTTHTMIAVAAGNYPGVFHISVPAVLSGPSTDPSQVFLSSPNHDAIIAFLDTATIGLQGVTVGGNTVANAPQAITIGSGATIAFDRVIVRDNTGVGTFCSGSTLTVRRYEAYTSQYGILADDASTLNVDRSYLHENKFAGLGAAGNYTIVNSILAKNAIGFIPFGSANSGALDFITFASQTSTVISSTHAISATDSIFSMNNDPPSASVAITYSLFDATAPAGAGNLSGAPAFVDPNGDYHIGATSMAIDHADPASTMDHDYDGDSRPHGSARDMGADER